MKKIYYIVSLALAAGMLAGCSNETSGVEEIVPTETTGNNKEITRNFPENNGAEELTGNEVEKFWKLLQGADAEFSRRRASYSITDEQFEEIKEFTTDMLKKRHATTETQKYEGIWNWIRTNIKYNTTLNPYYSNEPYEVFKNKVCVCQGYANIMSVMALSQGIEVINVNGILQGYGGHAWNYVRYNNTWKSIDPTNGGQYTASATGTYDNWLIPYSADGNLLETSQYGYSFKDAMLNLNEVKEADYVMLVPFSVTLNNDKSYQVSCFSPSKPLPENVREIYFGTNIKSLGSEGNVGLKEFAPNVEAAYVDPNNTSLYSYEGVVYKFNVDEPEYIPAAMKKIKLQPMQVIGKNLIFDHSGIEEMVVANGTKEIQAWAVEKCPNLKVAYIPLGTKVDENAFDLVHKDFHIVWQDQTGIREITAD